MDEDKINNNTTRFSDRIEDYVKYRPKYPDEIIPFLKTEIGLKEYWIVADIGSGTGILTELFLKNGNKVFGIEPNNEMREASEKFLKSYHTFTSLNGEAESVPLQENSIYLITAGQAFHWFDIDKSKKEFKRTLKKDGWTILLWNERLTEIDAFSKAYEKLLFDYSIDYGLVDHRRVDNNLLNTFFTSFQLKIFSNKQELDFQGLKGRLLSSSYTPKEDHKNYIPMINKLHEIFEENQKSGKTVIRYNTLLYYGKL